MVQSSKKKKKKKIKENLAPWLTGDIKKHLNEQDKLLREM